MSDRVGSEAVVGGIGCLLAASCWIGGPLLVGWILHSITSWPMWVIVIVALLIGERVGSFLFAAVLIPLFSLASAFSKGYR